MADDVSNLGDQTLTEVNDALGRAAEVDSSARQELADVQAASTAVNESRITAVVQEAGEQTSEAEAVQELVSLKFSKAGAAFSKLQENGARCCHGWTDETTDI